MILRIDRLQTELPPPSDPDPAGVQELLTVESVQIHNRATQPRCRATGMQAFCVAVDSTAFG